LILLDSNVLIDALRREPAVMAALVRWDAAGEELGAASPSVAEILRGAQRDQATLAATTRVLAGLVEVPFGPRAARRFGRLMHALDKAGSPIPALDGMVAAVALEEGARLATRDRKHVERVAGLELLAP
jgi:predicted nucleic acid-binding protein